MTPNQIKAEYQETQRESGHFFDRDTMRWFGDTMRSFGARSIDGVQYLYRKPTAYVNVFGKWQVANRTFFNAWRFENGDLNYCNSDETERVWNTLFPKSYSDVA